MTVWGANILDKSCYVSSKINVQVISILDYFNFTLKGCELNAYSLTPHMNALRKRHLNHYPIYVLCVLAIQQEIKLYKHKKTKT